MYKAIFRKETNSYRIVFFAHAWIVVLTLTLASAASARIDPMPKDASCKTPNVRTGVRPDASGPPTNVAVSIFLIDIMEISDVTQTLTGDFALTQSWTDPRLVHFEGCEIALDKIWSPELVFLNTGRKITSRPMNASIGPDGQVKYVQRYYGKFATYHNLQDFPFDKQTFRISVVSFKWLREDVQLVADKKMTGRKNQLNVSGWTVDRVEGLIDRENSEVFKTYYSRYDFKISAHRIVGYYLWKVILPLCLIVFMSWCVFWINPAQFGPQIGLSATSMLTLIAFIFATTNMVPELGYLTLLDRFIVGSTILVFLALVESATTIYLVSKERKELAMRIDRISRLVFPLAFVAITVKVFILYG